MSDNHSSSFRSQPGKEDRPEPFPRICLSSGQMIELHSPAQGHLGNTFSGLLRNSIDCIHHLIYMAGRTRPETSGRPQASGHFRPALHIMPTVPAIDRLRLGFDGAMRKHSVINAAANDA